MKAWNPGICIYTHKDNNLSENYIICRFRSEANHIETLFQRLSGWLTFGGGVKINQNLTMFWHRWLRHFSNHDVFVRSTGMSDRL